MKPLLIATLALLPLAVAPQLQAQTLTPAQTEATLMALDDEYHALSFYEAVIAKLGPVRPFSKIVSAEETHAQRLIGVLEAAGVAIPANPYQDGSKPLPEVPATRAEACAIGVAAEIANKDLYDDKLLPVAAGNAELTAVFTALRDASQERHLPAFERCAG